LLEAGLLTYSTFNVFPSNDSDINVKSFKELTAAGTVLDLNKIPFLILTYKVETKSRAKV